MDAQADGNCGEKGIIIFGMPADFLSPLLLAR